MTDSRDEHEPYGVTDSPVIASIDLGDLVALQAAIVRLTVERDEARREVLLWVKERCSWAELSQEIKQRGWEYLKEDGK
jgi:hypothetical protein